MKKKATILRSAMRTFTCQIEEESDKKQEIQATSIGNLLKFGDLVPGDLVEVELNAERSWVITELHPRKNEIFRYLPRVSTRKVMASNCDLLCILVSSSKPSFKRGLLDRFLIRSVQWNVPCIVVFNKIDEYDPQIFDIEQESNRVAQLCEKILQISAKTHEGLDQLRSILKNKRTLFLGASGVGKSKTIKELTNGEVQLIDQNLGKSNKGQHTTTWAQIINFEEFSFIDSPGIRSLSLDDINKNDLIHYFPDLHPYALKCQFTNCQHERNSKGCFFYKDSLPDTILGRLESYKAIFLELG